MMEMSLAYLEDYILSCPEGRSSQTTEREREREREREEARKEFSKNDNLTRCGRSLVWHEHSGG
jgi:hypothetical protein